MPLNSPSFSQLASNPSSIEQTNLYQITLTINNIHKIHKNNKQLTGTITLTPKVTLMNIPVEVCIIGESRCVVYEEGEQFSDWEGKCKGGRQVWGEGLQGFGVHETEEGLVGRNVGTHEQLERELQQQLQLRKSLQSNEFLSEKHSSSSPTTHPSSPPQVSKETFLQGWQLLYQYVPSQKSPQQQEKSSNESKQQQQQKLIALLPNTKYEYPFSFYFPENLPISVDGRVFKGVELFVGYRVVVGLQMSEMRVQGRRDVTDHMPQNEQQQQRTPAIRTTITQQFLIAKPPSSSSCLNRTTNKFTFKHYTPSGQHHQHTRSSFFCLPRCLTSSCLRLFNLPYRYDLYHCELIASINTPRTLHLTARIFLQPNKEKLDMRKVKHGNLYVTQHRKGNDESIGDNRSRENNDKNKGNKNQMTISKIIEEETDSPQQVRIKAVSVKLIGEIVGVKKVVVFERVVVFNRVNYDALEGEVIVHIERECFSEKNQLFEIRYWFQVEPVGDEEGQLGEGSGTQRIQPFCEGQAQAQNQDNGNDFNITFSQLMDKEKEKQNLTKNRKKSKAKQKVHKDSEQKKKQTNHKTNRNKNFQKLTQQIHFLQL